MGDHLHKFECKTGRGAPSLLVALSLEGCVIGGVSLAMR